jgi:hypothetical protein
MKTRCVSDGVEHECGPLCELHRPDGEVACRFTGRVLCEAPRPPPAARRTTKDDRARRFECFLCTTRSVMARLLHSPARTRALAQRAEKARAAAQRVARARHAQGYVQR